MKIVSILKSQASYERIKNELHYPEVNWQLETSIERLRSALSTDYFDLVILDHTIDNFDQIIELLDYKQIKILIFRGKYDEIVREVERKITDYLKEEILEDKIHSESLKASQDEQGHVRIMVKEVVKTERVEIPVIQNMANSVITFVNLSERAGSTFIASNVARSFAKRDVPVTLYESPIGTVDAYYTMGFYDESKSYYSYREAMQNTGRIDRAKLPYTQGIRVAVNEPGFDAFKWSEKDTLKLMASQSGINIVDLGWNYEDPLVRDILNISNVVYVVIDPILTQIVRNEKRLEDFEKLKFEGMDIRFIFNKFDNAINRTKFEEGFNLKSKVIIPFIPAKDIYNSYYKSEYEFLVDNSLLGEELDQSFHSILLEYLTLDEMGIQKIKKKLFSFGR